VTSEASAGAHTVADFVRGYEEEGRLRGFRCPACGFVTATWGLACSRCGRAGLEESVLADRGTVGAFTIVHVPGEELLNEAPYAYVVVDLEGGGRVTGWIPGIATDAELAIGTKVHRVSSYKPGLQFARDAKIESP
jgi:uncharacterized OB-fold protein